MRKFSRKTQGVISVFLILILVPTMVFSALLVDGSRMVSARTITQEAADLAALSVLSDYNVELKDNFGLFALNNSEKAEELFQESLKATLQISGLDAPTYSEQVWEILKKTLGASSFTDKTFMNLYDFKVDEVSVTPLYSLANPEVLQSQIVEYSKYRGLYILGERMEFLAQIGEITKLAQEQDETADVMENKIDIDEQNMEAAKKLKEIRDLTQELNEQLAGMQGQKEAYFQKLNGKMEELAGNGGGGEYSKGKEEAEAYYKKLDEIAGKLNVALPGTKSETQSAINRLGGFIQLHESSANGTIQQMVEEAGQNQDAYQKCLEDLSTLEQNPVFQKLIEHHPGEQIAGAISQIDMAIHKYAGERVPRYDENGEEIEDPYKFYYYALDSNTENINSAKGDYSSAWDEALGLEYSVQVPTVRSDSFYGSEDENKSSQLKEMAKNQSSSAEDDSAEEGRERQEVDSEIFDNLPSKTFDPAKEAAEYAPLLEEDSGQSGGGGEAEHYGEDASQELNLKSYENGNEKESLEASKSILDSGKCSYFLTGLVGLAEGVRDEVLTLTYIFGTFKTRMTGNEAFKKGQISESDLDKFYIPKWRFEHEEGELDMRFSPKSERTTQLNAQIEYLIYGMSSDLKNESAAYTSIFAPRLANNMIALYGNEGVKNACRGAAAAASAATLGTVPEPVFFWIFLTTWAVAETVIDMHYLIQKGYKIPLFKTKDNLILTVDHFGSSAEAGLVGKYESSSGIYVCYEDYLLFFLLLCGSNKRLMRTADLIEMDMKKEDGDFQMEGAYTFIRVKSNLSIRYLFANTPVFSEEYASAGLTGRMKFKNVIYQGY